MRTSIWHAVDAEVYYDKRTGQPQAIRLLGAGPTLHRSTVAVWILRNPGLAAAIRSASLEAIESRAAYDLSKLGCIAPDIVEET